MFCYTKLPVHPGRIFAPANRVENPLFGSDGAPMCRKLRRIMGLPGFLAVFGGKIRGRKYIDKVNPIWQNDTRFCLAKLNRIFRRTVTRKGEKAVLTINESMSIGDKIRRLRIKYGLTQEELAARTELSKGFISQVERDLASPSIATLMDILEALGTNIRDFFNETIDEKIVFGANDIFVQEDETGFQIRWLVTTSQKNSMEPIMLTLEPGGRSMVHNAHEGEEFGHVLSGGITLCIGSRRLKVKKGDSFYYRPTDQHWLENTGKLQAKLLWVSSPPSF